MQKRSNSHRLDRINSELQREISHVIDFELKNANITGMISVTRVKITPDLRYAKVFVSVINSNNINKTLEGLKKASGFIRTRIANTVNLRTTPELVFVYDDSDIQGSKIDQIIAEARRKDEELKAKYGHADEEENEEVEE
jgi:ribosome-binding factor A